MKSKLVRFDDWQDRLATFFEVVSEKPFEWGVHDCALFATLAVQRITGVDIAEKFRGQYSDRKGAAKALREFGSGTLIRTLDDLLGKHKPASLAKRGDLVMYRGSVGVCCGTFSRFVGEYDEALQPIVDGEELTKRSQLIPIPTLSCQRAWSV